MMMNCLAARRVLYFLAASCWLAAWSAEGLTVPPQISGSRRGVFEESWFEGPEKTLEICFAENVGHPRGCRALRREDLASILAEARCSVLSSMSNDNLDAYVLSESSLFVFPRRVVVKTCGTTTPLRCLGRLLELATLENTLGLRLEWVGYSRKHCFSSDRRTHFEEETRDLESHAKGGSGHLLGPITGDHWFVYVSNSYRQIDETKVNVMMFDLDEDARRLFYLGGDENPGALSGSVMTRRSGLDRLVENYESVDEMAFEPCGYSMNAIDGESYATVHVTPQRQCSYASFETNSRRVDSADLVRDVLSTFRPKRAVVTLFSHSSDQRDDDDEPLVSSIVLRDHLGSYDRADVSSLTVQNSFCVMANYALNLQSDSSCADAVAASSGRRDGGSSSRSSPSRQSAAVIV